MTDMAAVKEAPRLHFNDRIDMIKNKRTDDSGVSGIRNEIYREYGTH